MYWRLLIVDKQAAEICREQLQIWREIGSRMGEARALNSLGNIYHVQAKDCLQQKTSLIVARGVQVLANIAWGAFY